MRISIEQAEDLLASDEVIAIPTETVYGLAARIDNEQAIHKIYTLKKRPPLNPLIVHVTGIQDVHPFVRTFPPGFESLAKEFWPGPLTLVIPVIEQMISSTIRAGLPTCAFRAPRHDMAQELISRTGPLVAPSANLSGKPSATCRSHIEDDFGLSFPILDGGETTHGLESTILVYHDSRWLLGRKGSIPAETLAEFLNQSIGNVIPESHICPGLFYRHYAPLASLVLTKTPQNDVIVGYSDRPYPSSSKVFFLGRSDNPSEVARNLYTTLRALDANGICAADVDIDIPHDGLWETILERLNRASKR